VDQERKELHRSLINHREAIHGQMVFIDGPWIASSAGWCIINDASPYSQRVLINRKKNEEQGKIGSVRAFIRRRMNRSYRICSSFLLSLMSQRAVRWV
jgi:hypothetical protein